MKNKEKADKKPTLRMLRRDGGWRVVHAFSLDNKEKRGGGIVDWI